MLMVNWLKIKNEYSYLIVGINIKRLHVYKTHFKTIHFSQKLLKYYYINNIILLNLEKFQIFNAIKFTFFDLYQF